MEKRILDNYLSKTRKDIFILGIDNDIRKINLAKKFENFNAKFKCESCMSIFVMKEIRLRYIERYTYHIDLCKTKPVFLEKLLLLSNSRK